MNQTPNNQQTVVDGNAQMMCTFFGEIFKKILSIFAIDFIVNQASGAKLELWDALNSQMWLVNP